MNFELFVALRYLTSRRKQAMVSVISLISIGGIAAGVAALIIALALSTGFKEEIQARILGATAHINLLRLDGGPIRDFRQLLEQVRGMPGVIAASPTIYDKVFLSFGRNAQGAVLKGIDPRLEKESSELFAQVVEGDMERLLPGETEEGQPDGILLGRELGNALGLRVGDVVRAYYHKGPLSPFGPAPALRNFRVIGFFSSGLWDYDANWGYLSLPSAQRLFSMPAGSASTVEFRVRDIYGVEGLAEQIRSAAGPGFAVTHWIELNRPLFSALKLEKLAMFVTVCLIVLVAAFGIVTTLIMMVMEKNRDIAILMAMGMTRRMIVRVFMLQGLIQGVLGTLAGSAIGIGASLLLDHFRLIRLEAQVYAIAWVPFRVLPLDVVLVAASAVLISFLATIYPARAASRLDPVEAIRYE